MKHLLTALLCSALALYSPGSIVVYDHISSAPPPGSDEYFANVALLLHCDGTNGSTTFTDTSSSPKTVTARGNAQVTTATKKFGTGGLALDGIGDYLDVTASGGFDFGTAPFTIEFFINFQSSALQYLFDFSTVNTSAWAITPSNGSMYTYSQGAYGIIGGSTAFALNTWYHLALVRSGDTWTVYRDGSLYQQVTGLSSRTFGSGSLNFFLGIAGNGVLPTQATLDEFRITKGVARTITVPTSAYPDS